LEEIDFVKVATLNTYVNTLGNSKKFKDICICGQKVTGDAKILPMCGHEVHKQCLLTFLTVAAGFSRICCPICKKSYFSQVWATKPEQEVLTNAKETYKQKLEQ